jgi:hypothetical protein
MYWNRLSIIALIGIIGILLYDRIESEGVSAAISPPEPKVYTTATPMPVETPSPIVIVQPKAIGTPLSDRIVPDTMPTPTEVTALNIVNKNQFLWIASQTSWRPYLYANDYEIFEKLWAIASCESGNDNGWIRVDRVGDTDIDDGPSLGLMQINIFYWPMIHEVFNLFDPVDNLQAAWEIWYLQGWEPWSCHAG